MTVVLNTLFVLMSFLVVFTVLVGMNRVLFSRRRRSSLPPLARALSQPNALTDQPLTTDFAAALEPAARQSVAPEPLALRSPTPAAVFERHRAAALALSKTLHSTLAWQPQHTAAATDKTTLENLNKIRRAAAPMLTYMGDNDSTQEHMNAAREIIGAHLPAAVGPYLALVSAGAAQVRSTEGRSGAQEFADQIATIADMCEDLAQDVYRVGVERLAIERRFLASKARSASELDLG